MRVVAVTKIFPSSLEPLSAPFNRQQLAELARLCDLEVLAAVPHLPLARALGAPARAARLAALPERERVHGVDVTYVRQLYVPRVGLAVAIPLYLASLLPHARRLAAADVVLAAWAYPDGCAAVLAARALGKPCVVKVHGSDVHVVLRRPAPRAIASAILPGADAVVAVSRPLAGKLTTMGLEPSRVHLVPNGVDGALFRPRDRRAARVELGVPDDARLVLFVGRLEKKKGVGELLEAFGGVRARVPRSLLALAGEGELTPAAQERARTSPDAFRVLGPRPHAQVATWMAACDVLVLPSWAEGTPNVVLEALASGRPAVATRVGGIPDVLPDAAGVLVPPRDAAALAGALVAALGRAWDPEAVRACGPRSWAESAAALRDVLEGVQSARGRGPAPQRDGLRESPAPARSAARAAARPSG